jgi:D-glycero-D-manno-heptose 1,7-bisphosphate phosphatase
MTPQRCAVFLDRDGVLNEPLVHNGRALAPISLEDFHLVEGAGREVARLQAASLLCIVITNQPEVSRRLLDVATLKRMHEHLREATGVDDVFVCLHDPREGCRRHKPRPGMLLAAARKYAIDLPRSFVIGDRWRDIEAGRAAGCCTVLLDRPYSACQLANVRVGTLQQAVDFVLARRRGEP